MVLLNTLKDITVWMILEDHRNAFKTEAELFLFLRAVKCIISEKL